MSDGTKPRSKLSSGEFRAYVQSNLAAIVYGIAIVSSLVTLTLYIASKPSKDDVVEMLKVHESKNAHHGVQQKILASAPTRIDFALLKHRVDALERRNAEWKKDVKQTLKDIKRAINRMARRLPRRRYKGRQNGP